MYEYTFESMITVTANNEDEAYEIAADSPEWCEQMLITNTTDPEARCF